MKTLLLVDGSSYLYRAFHAMPEFTAPDGTPTGAIYGVVNMLKRLEKDVAADYTACVFDAKGKTFRHALYPEYKAQRPSMPDGLAAQIDLVHQMVNALGWPILMIDGVEADDVLATLARQAEREAFQVVISTGDKDLAQLVTPQIRLFNTMDNKWFDEAGVIEKFGVPPARIIDFLTLTGDKIDNIPGVTKCGDKTAQKWLAEYDTLEAVMTAGAEGKIGGKIGEHLRAALPHLPLSRQLVQVKDDVDLSAQLPHGLSQLARRPSDRSALAALCQRLGFKTWLREYADAAPSPSPETTTEDLFATPVAPAAPTPPTRERHYHTILTEADLAAWCVQLQAADVVSLDTETTSLNPLSAQLVGISFAITPYEAAYLPLAHTSIDPTAQIPLSVALAQLKPWLESADHKKLGQHLKYDRHIFANHGITLAGIVDDTLLMSYVIESHESHGMDALAARHLHETTLTYEEVCGKGAKQIGFAEVDLDTATRYAAEDADITLRLAQHLKPQLTGQLLEVYQTIELPSADVLYRMERTGVLIDRDVLARQSHELGQSLLALEHSVYELAGQPFNLNSPKQVSEILFGKLGIDTKGLKKTAGGAISTDESTLEKLAEDFPIARKLLDYRALAKLKSTYTDKLPSMINPHTGRVHTTYSQAVAITGRLSSSDPNLQNIPVRTAEGRRVREAFIAPHGMHIVSADYSQIELRIMAHLSQDAGLLKAFCDGQDIHRATAAEIFGLEPESVTSEQRRYAKTINFGLIYGMSAFGLAKSLGIERNAAQGFIERYFQRYPGVAHYMEETRQAAREQGYVETVFGRRLYLPELTSGPAMRRQGAERAAINAPMQGTAADLIKLAMIQVQARLDRENLSSRLMMQVHDELVLEVPDAELESVRHWLPEVMAGVAQLSVPLLAEVGSGPNWEAAH